MHWYSWWKLCFPKKEGGMGFHDLHSFNLAMLSKQVWRLIDDPTSLCAQVLRAKYYPSGDILQARPKSGSSFTWQSIVAGIQTFKRGCIWRVGNGDHIDIWRDPWVPSSPDRKISTPRGECILRKVSDLIDPISGIWDSELIQGIFHPIDANGILQIPLHYNVFDDFVAWHGTKSGVFSVRSAYHIEWKHQFNGLTFRSLISGTSLNNPIWKNLWKLDAPAKVKIFCWRLMHGIIPIKAILMKRHIGTTDLCPMCNLEPEDTMHMVFTCQRAAQIWNMLGVETIIQREMFSGRSGVQVMEALLKSSLTSVPGYSGINVKEVIAIGAWYIWWLRRRQTHGEQVPPVRCCVNSIRAIVANAARSNSPATSIKKTSWLKPRAGFMKLNVDAAFSAIDHMGASGVILRDGQGGFVAAKTIHLSQVSSVSMAEALALLHGLSFARSLGYHAIEAESDSLEVIQLCLIRLKRIYNF
jgi:hypothetical protein